MQRAAKLGVSGQSFSHANQQISGTGFNNSTCTVTVAFCISAFCSTADGCASNGSSVHILNYMPLLLLQIPVWQYHRRNPRR